MATLLTDDVTKRSACTKQPDDCFISEEIRCTNFTVLVCNCAFYYCTFFPHLTIYIYFLFPIFIHSNEFPPLARITVLIQWLSSVT